MNGGCICAACTKACTIKPGIFAPGEAEKAAEYLGIPWEEFTRDYVVMDYYSFEEDVFYYIPRMKDLIQGMKASYADGFETGTCIFLTDDNKCKIHPVKPSECKNYMGCVNHTVSHKEIIATIWKDAGNPLKELAESLGETGEREHNPYEILSMFNKLRERLES